MVFFKEELELAVSDVVVAGWGIETAFGMAMELMVKNFSCASFGGQWRTWWDVIPVEYCDQGGGADQFPAANDVSLALNLDALGPQLAFV